MHVRLAACIDRYRLSSFGMKLMGLALVALLLPADAIAQNRGIFIQAGPLADILFAPTTDYSTTAADPRLSASSSYVWFDLNGDRRWQPGEEGPLVSSSLGLGFPSLAAPRSKSRVTPGAVAALGVFITPTISLRVEGSYQGEHVSEADGGDLGGLSGLIDIEDRQASSMTDVVVAAGWHQGDSRRTTITYLGGMVFRRQRDEASLRYTISDRLLPPQIGLGGTIVGGVIGGLSLPNEEFSATSYSAGVMAGVDVTINFSDHLAAVPQVRMVAADHSWSVRPAVAMRWRP